ncbi:hypothetical protein PMG11_10397 [Penicillium brasilianum]|uniref:Uncharacterized protein n=1 Tax=Penicillium brasilianum TaxID=104259 RepID=A0A0F7U0U3_PENBI|nr:hypothetical protein PMG11_10397 [Penicillium brasilianum]
MPPGKVPQNMAEHVAEDTLQVKPDHDKTQSGGGKTIFFGISSSYVQDWDAAAAFREIYQNWRDAILARFSLSRLDFQPVYEDRGDCVAVVVPDPTRQDRQGRALGFIKYNKHDGCVTISNSCVEIGLNVLELGYSSKRLDSNAAGCHGEGLKLAALVMVRSGLNVDLFASRNHWRFGLLRSHFYCEIKPSEDNGSAGRDPAEDMFRLSPMADRDVTLEIRAPSESKKNALSLDDFHGWLAITCDIRGLTHPSDILETDAGDLILDPKFYGRIYLNGMHLPCSGSELQQYRFAYNFLHGKVNRDRQILVDRDEEANMVRRIWEAAIRKHRVAFLPIYVNLLRNFPKALDIESAAHFLESPTKHLIWKYLLDEAGDDKFYYNENSSAEVSSL